MQPRRPGRAIDLRRAAGSAIQRELPPVPLNRAAGSSKRSADATLAPSSCSGVDGDADCPSTSTRPAVLDAHGVAFVGRGARGPQHQGAGGCRAFLLACRDRVPGDAVETGCDPPARPRHGPPRRLGDWLRATAVWWPFEVASDVGSSRHPTPGSTRSSRRPRVRALDVRYRPGGSTSRNRRCPPRRCRSTPMSTDARAVLPAARTGLVEALGGGVEKLETPRGWPGSRSTSATEPVRHPSRAGGFSTTGI